MNGSVAPIVSRDIARVNQGEPRRLGTTVSGNSVVPILNRWIGIFDGVAVALVAVAALLLHLRFVTHVGGLWRDEANSVQIASLPHFGDIWHSLDFDSFPLLFFALLRTWTTIFGSHNEIALRALGFVTGVALLGAAWIAVRTPGGRLPVISVALIGLNPMLIRYGDSTRAYGLGMLLMLLTFASFWGLISSDSRPKAIDVLKATLLAVLSTQCLYYNSVLLFATISGAVVVCLRRRTWRTGIIAILIGVVAAAGLLPYLPMMVRMREWTFLVSYDVDMAWLWHRSCEVLGSPDPIGIWIWVMLFTLTVGGALPLIFFCLKREPKNAALDGHAGAEAPVSDPVLFAGVSVIVAVPAYAIFLKALHYYTQPWYYISLAAFAACAIDIAFGAWPVAERFHPSLVMRWLRPIIAIGLLCLTGLPDWKEIATRHTNIDLIADRLRALSAEGDVVLVSQWENAVALSYHYHGRAQIVTVPDIPEHRFHRYDLVLKQMLEEDPVRNIRPHLENCLSSGHSVFVAGTLEFPPASLRLHKGPLAPGERNSTASRTDYRLWQLQVGQFLRAHATEVAHLDVPVPGKARVQDFENVDLSVIHGWR